MKIVINAVAFCHGGGVTYLRSLLQHLPTSHGHQVRVFAPPKAVATLTLPGVEVIAVPWGARGLLQRLVWERVYLSWYLRIWKAELLFVPGCILNTFVPRQCKTVVTLHNMLPFTIDEVRRYPPGWRRFRLLLLQRAMRRSIARADLAIFQTPHGRQVLGQFVPEAAGRAAVISHGVESEFLAAYRRPPSASPVDGPYLLYVSSLHYYKAHREVIRAYAQLRQLRRTKERLVLIGDGDSQCLAGVQAEIMQHGLADVVVMLGHILRATLPSYYRHAQVILCASRCEALGFTLLEAMGAGRPLVVSDYPPMPYLAGDAAVYFHPDDPDDLAEKLAALLDDPTRQQQLALLATARAARFSCREAAMATWAAFDTLGRTR